MDNFLDWNITIKNSTDICLTGGEWQLFISSYSACSRSTLIPLNQPLRNPDYAELGSSLLRCSFVGGLLDLTDRLRLKIYPYRGAQIWTMLVAVSEREAAGHNGIAHHL